MRRAVAVVQMRATRDVESNFQRASALIVRAVKEQGAKFICLPEAFDWLGPPPGEARPLDCDLVRRYQKLAETHATWLSLGGFHEIAEKDKVERKMYNSHIILDDSGLIRAVYRKIHLFDAKLESGYRESDRTSAGRELVLVRNTPIGNVGLATCYDMRFPAMFQIYQEAGADVILLPSAFTKTTGKAGHWHALLRARAIETQTFVVAAAQCGDHNPNRSSYGHSLIVDPFGRILCDLGEDIDENVATVHLDFDELTRARAAMPVLAHRKKVESVVAVRLTEQGKLVNVL